MITSHTANKTFTSTIFNRILVNLIRSSVCLPIILPIKQSSRLRFVSVLLLAQVASTAVASTAAQKPLAFAASHAPSRHAHRGQVKGQESLGIEMEPSLNVHGQKLEQCGTNPMTGFFRTGYCDTASSDFGSHTVAAIVSDSWLDFSASKGNDLRGLLTGGCRWCLCATRWKESLDAFKRGEIGRDGVPKVDLSATHQKALDHINLDDLKAFSAEKKSLGSTDPWSGGPIR